MYQDKPKLIICKASAGSGKTFNLVKEYLKLAFSEKDGAFKADRFKHILAITFTNKAANEMKERIMKDLTEIANDGDNSGMAKVIVDEWVEASGNTLDATVAMNTVKSYAAQVKQSILHNYSDFSVLTIDSFMQRIAKTFAYDLKLPMNYNVSLDTDDIIEMAVDEMLEKAGTEGNDELSDFLKSCFKDNLEEGHNYNSMKNQILSSVGALFDEESIAHIDSLSKLGFDKFDKVKKKLLAENQDFLNKLKGYAQMGVDLLEENGVEIDDLYGGSRSIGEYFKEVATGNKFELGNTYVTAFVGQDDILVSGQGRVKKDIVESIKPQLCNCYTEIANLLSNELVHYNTRKLLLMHIPMMALLNVLRDIIKQDSMENELIHISEFNNAIAKVVQEEPMPFVYERVGVKYCNFLIDEFQDTSKQQWLNLVPLLENGVAEGHTSLVVGDAKQAIYRFRNGDVNQFLELPKVHGSQHGDIFMKKGIEEDRELSVSRRSYEEIVNFNNGLYQWIEKKYHDSLGKIYMNGEQDVDEKKRGKGYVEVKFFSPALTEKYEETLFEELAKEIRYQTEVNHYQLRDIKVLARRNKILSGIGAFLANEGIDVVSNDSFSLGNSRVVMIITFMLHYLLDSSDRVSALQALMLLREVKGDVVKDDFEDDFVRTKGTVDMAVILERYGINLNYYKLREMTLYDCCEELIDELGLRGIEDRFVYTFLNKVATFENKHGQNLVELLDYLDERIGIKVGPNGGKKKISSKTSTEDNAVELMTVHSSKGLEGKVVLYVLTKDTIHSEKMWVNTDIDEMPIARVSLSASSNTDYNDDWKKEESNKQVDEVNVMYVATTRPREKLFVYCNTAPSVKKAYNDEKNGKKTKKKDEAVKKEEEVNPKIEPIQLLYDYVTGLNPSTSNCEIERNADDAWSLVCRIGENSEAVVKEEGEKDDTAKIKRIKESSKTIVAKSHKDWISDIKIAHDSKVLQQPTQDERIQRGVRLHEVLSKVKTAADVDVAVARYAKKYNLSEEDRLAMQRCVEEVVNGEESARFFAEGLKVYNEHELGYMGVKERKNKAQSEDKSTGNGKDKKQETIVLRPDRVVFANDEVWVVDFKTGHFQENYVTQVQTYCSIIQQMGYEHVSGYLIYIGGDKVDVEKV